MKVRISSTAAAVFIIFGITFAQSQNRPFWRTSLSLSRNVNRSSLMNSLPLSGAGPLKAHGKTILRQTGILRGLKDRRMAMASKVNSLVPLAKPLPPNIDWVKVYGEANPNKTNENLLDVEAHTEILHFADQTQPPQSSVAKTLGLSLSGYGPVEESETTKIDQQAGSTIETQGTVQSESENPYGGGVPVITETEKPTAVTTTKGGIGFVPKTEGRETGHSSTTISEEITGLSEGVTELNEGFTAPSVSSTESKEGTTESKESSVGLTERTTESSTGPTEGSTGPQEGGKMSLAASSKGSYSTEVPSTGGESIGSEAVATESKPEGTGTEPVTEKSTSGGTEHPQTELTNLQSGAEEIGYGGGVEATEEHPSTKKSPSSISSSSLATSSPPSMEAEAESTTFGTGMTSSTSTSEEEATSMEHEVSVSESSEAATTEGAYPSEETEKITVEKSSSYPSQEITTETGTTAQQTSVQSISSESLSSLMASTTPESTSHITTEGTAISGSESPSTIQSPEVLPGYGGFSEPEGTTKVSEEKIGLPGLSREPAKQLSKSVEEATTLSTASEVSTVEEAKITKEGAETEEEKLEGSTELVTSSTGASETTEPQTQESQMLAEELTSLKPTEKPTELQETSKETETTYITPSEKSKIGPTKEKAESTETSTAPSEAETSSGTGPTELSEITTELTKTSWRSSEPSERATTLSESTTEEGTSKTSKAGVETEGGLPGYGEIPSPSRETESTEETSSPLPTEASSEGTVEPKSTEEITASEYSEGTTEPFSYEATEMTETSEESGKQTSSIEISTRPGATVTEMLEETKQPSEEATRASELTTTVEGKPAGYGAESLETTTERTPQSSEGAPRISEEIKTSTEKAMEGTSEKTSSLGVEKTESTVHGVTKPFEETMSHREETTESEAPVPRQEVTALKESITSEKAMGETESTSTIPAEPSNVPTGPEDFGYGGGKEEITEKHPGGSSISTSSTSLPGEKSTESSESTSTEPSVTGGGESEETQEISGSSEGATEQSESTEMSKPTERGTEETSGSENVPEHSITTAVPKISESTTKFGESSAKLPQYGAETVEKPTDLTKSTEEIATTLTGTAEGISSPTEAATLETSKLTSESEGTVGLPGLASETTRVTGYTVPKEKGLAEAPGTAPITLSQGAPSKIPTGPEDFGYGGGTEKAETKASVEPQVTETSKMVAESTIITSTGVELTTVQQPSAAETSTNVEAEGETTKLEATSTGASTVTESAETSNQYSSETTSLSKSSVASTEGTEAYPVASEETSEVVETTESAGTEPFTVSGQTSVQFSAETTLLQTLSESTATSAESTMESYSASEETPESVGTTEFAETRPSTISSETTGLGTSTAETPSTGESARAEVTVESSSTATTERPEVENTISEEQPAPETSTETGATKLTASWMTSPSKPFHDTQSMATTVEKTESMNVTQEIENVPAKIPMGPEDFGYGGGKEISDGVLTSPSTESLTVTRQGSSATSEMTNSIETSANPELVSSTEYTAESTPPSEGAEASNTVSASETFPSAMSSVTPFTVTQKLFTMLEEGSTATNPEATHGGESESISAKIPTGPEDFGYGSGPAEADSAASFPNAMARVPTTSVGRNLPDKSNLAASANHESSMAVVSNTATDLNDSPTLRRPKKVFTNLPLQKVDDSTRRKWRPYVLDCAVETDEKGHLCHEWAKGGLCETHRPTMFLFCRRTCLCVGPPTDLRRL